MVASNAYSEKRNEKITRPVPLKNVTKQYFKLPVTKINLKQITCTVKY